MVSQIPGAINVPVHESLTNQTQIWGGDFKTMDIFTDTENTAGLGANTQMLKIGKDLTTESSRSAGVIFLTHPNDKVVDNGDGTKALQQYPITKMSMNVRLPKSQVQRKGFFLTRGKTAETYNAETGAFEMYRTISTLALNIIDGEGFAVYFKHSPSFTVQYTVDGEKITGIDILDGSAMNNNDNPVATGVKSGIGKKTTLGAQAIDADGNALTAELQAVLDTFFKEKTTLTTDEQWVHLETFAENATNTNYVLTLHLDGYDALKVEHPALPEALRIKITHSNNYNKNTNDLGLGGFGMLSSQSGRSTTGVAITDLSVEYDISSYFAAAAEEFKTSFAADYAAVVGSNGYFDQKDLTAVNALLDSYAALADGVKTLLADDAAVVAKLSALQSAKAALDDGAYYFDAFDHGLNYKVISKVESDITKDVSGAPVSIKDDLIETNIYSETAASKEGENGTAFWGIHTDSANAANNALWLRKSFNSNNYKAQENNSQGWPNVLYTLKDGILPEGAEVQKITGKMWYPGTHYKDAMGVMYKYDNEYRWYATALSYGLFKDEKLNESGMNFDWNWGCYKDIATGESTKDKIKWQKDQWVDFTMDYSAEQGAYMFTIKGIDGTGVSAEISVYTPSCEPLTRVGFFNGDQTKQCFDDIAVTLKGYEPIDFAPDTLGAKILKQPTENGDQNLRIDFDFSNTIANGADKNIVEYGAILQAGTQEKAALMDAENADRTFVALPVANISEIPQTLIVTVSNSAENSGKRVSAIGYVKDAEGNYYYSENDNEVISNGLAVKSVMGVMKAWYLDVSASDTAGVKAAAEAYKAADAEQTLTVDEILEKVAAYANGTVTTESPEYALCKELLSKVFHYYYNAAQA